MLATSQLSVLPRSVLMLKKILHTTCHFANLPFSLPFSSHQLCSLLLSGEKGFSQHANFAAEQAHLYLVKGRLPQMCPLSTLCFCGRRGLLALEVPVLSWLRQDHDDGLQKNKKKEKNTQLQLQGMALMCYLCLERTASLSTVAVCDCESS